MEHKPEPTLTHPNEPETITESIESPTDTIKEPQPVIDSETAQEVESGEEENPLPIPTPKVDRRSISSRLNLEKARKARWKQKYEEDERIASFLADNSDDSNESDSEDDFEGSESSDESDDDIMEEPSYNKAEKQAYKKESKRRLDEIAEMQALLMEMVMKEKRKSKKHRQPVIHVHNESHKPPTPKHSRKNSILIDTLRRNLRD